MPAGGRHGARRRHDLRDRAECGNGRVHQRHAPPRQADRGRQDVLGGGLGAGGERRTGRTGVGRPAQWLKAHKTVTPRTLNTPRLIGMQVNAGMLA